MTMTTRSIRSLAAGFAAALVCTRGQGAYDTILGTAHLGILNSPQTWAAALEFLSARHHPH
jgi:hypothetical protein